jgi:glucose/arabinose dehydrogenase
MEEMMTRINFSQPESHFRRLPRFSFLKRILLPLTFLLCGSLIWTPAPPSVAATLPGGFTETLLANGLSSPTAMAIAPDGRIFVCQQGGGLRVIKNGALLATPFVTLSVNFNGERGLLGVAFDPDFAVNQYVYVYYTTPSSPIHNRVSRFTASGDVAVSGSEVVLLELNNLTSATNHNGGALHFGPDGKLYVAVGDNATSSNSQTLNNLLGKVLRLNADGTIPADNPFYSTATGTNRAIWTLGLRNPFTFNFQPGTGRVFINDVGQSEWEEINDGIAGSNYGWPTCEGVCNPPTPSFRDPVYAYEHLNGVCAITGGAFYNPATVQFPTEYLGKYFFADYCAGWIKTFDPVSNAVANFATGLSSAVDLQVSNEGSLLYLQRGAGSNTGQLWRVDYTASPVPFITQHPNNVSVTVGQPANFSVSAAGASPLSYQWQRNGADIAGANSATYTIASTDLSDSGSLFRCTVSNSSGAATSNEASLTVTTNQPPVASITQPVVGTLYQGGQTISYSGTGTDPETGTLAGSVFTWEVTFHHDEHTHPFIAPTSGSTGGSFTIPNTGETSANVFYRIHLTVTDPVGLTHSVYRDLLPRTSTITLQTNPAGLQVTLDGQPVIAPSSTLSVVGVRRTLGVVSPQNVGGTNYVFSSWSDGGAATHTITTPSSNTTYTATYVIPTCSYTLSSTSRTVSSSGGAFTVSVTAPVGCPWTAVSNASWITITGGSSGLGNGTVSYSVAANTGPQRTGTMTIAGKTFTVTQSSGCVYTISPTSKSFPASGGTGVVSVTAGVGCSWTARSNNSWITITSGASGVGNGTVGYSVKAVTSGSGTRTGSMTIAGKKFTVTQTRPN